MDSSVSRLASELKVKLHENWLKELGKFPAFVEAPTHEKRHVFLTQFLHCDLNNAGAGCLPENIKDWHGRVLEGEYVLQVDETSNMAAGAKQRYEQDGRTRCLKLLMTDGRQQICGIEHKHLGALKVNMPAGFKVIISNVLVRRGLLLLQPENFSLLGGQVARLEEARKRALTRWAQPSAGRGGQQGPPRSLYLEASAAAWPENPAPQDGVANQPGAIGGAPGAVGPQHAEPAADMQRPGPRAPGAVPFPIPPVPRFGSDIPAQGAAVPVGNSIRTQGGAGAIGTNFRTQGSAVGNNIRPQAGAGAVGSNVRPQGVAGGVGSEVRAQGARGVAGSDVRAQSSASVLGPATNGRGPAPGAPTLAQPPRGPGGGPPSQINHVRDSLPPATLPRPALAALQRAPTSVGRSAEEGSSAGNRMSAAGPAGRDLGNATATGSRETGTGNRVAHAETRELGFTRASNPGIVQQGVGPCQPGSRLSNEVPGEGAEDLCSRLGGAPSRPHARPNLQFRPSGHRPGAPVCPDGAAIEGSSAPQPASSRAGTSVAEPSFAPQSAHSRAGTSVAEPSFAPQPASSKAGTSVAEPSFAPQSARSRAGTSVADPIDLLSDSEDDPGVQHALPYSSINGGGAAPQSMADLEDADDDDVGADGRVRKRRRYLASSSDEDTPARRGPTHVPTSPSLHSNPSGLATKPWQSSSVNERNGTSPHVTSDQPNAELHPQSRTDRPTLQPDQASGVLHQKGTPGYNAQCESALGHHHQEGQCCADAGSLRQQGGHCADADNLLQQDEHSALADNLHQGVAPGDGQDWMHGEGLELDVAIGGNQMMTLLSLQDWVAVAQATDFPLQASVQGSMKQATTPLNFMNAQHEPLAEYSMGAIITDGDTDMEVMLSNALLEELLGLTLVELWELLRDHGKAAIQEQLDHMKEFLLTFNGIMHLLITDRTAVPVVMACVEQDPDDF